MVSGHTQPIGIRLIIITTDLVYHIISSIRFDPTSLLETLKSSNYVFTKKNQVNFRQEPDNREVSSGEG